MQMRGVQEAASLTRTTFWRGVYEDDPALRSEFLSLCGVGRLEKGREMKYLFRQIADYLLGMRIEDSANLFGLMRGRLDGHTLVPARVRSRREIGQRWRHE
jgi:hypothetical protein